MLLPVLIYADVPAQVPARARFAADERTAGGSIDPNGGSERRILVAVEADS